ncbi:MAG TPA: phosphoadenylyl-sulfate reductase, partial [Methylophilaceae bacterium]|nr:phosphoadenylyl-sulfate reductase [Methylophilaceae bacterium]
MSDTVSPLILKPNANNAVNRPEMTEALRQSIAAKRNVVEKLLADAVAEFGGRGAITFANSMGAEDMVLTD